MFFDSYFGARVGAFHTAFARLTSGPTFGFNPQTIENNTYQAIKVNYAERYKVEHQKNINSLLFKELCL